MQHACLKGSAIYSPNYLEISSYTTFLLAQTILAVFLFPLEP
jgi:hypothetical protein